MSVLSIRLLAALVGLHHIRAVVSVSGRVCIELALLDVGVIGFDSWQRSVIASWALAIQFAAATVGPKIIGLPLCFGFFPGLLMLVVLASHSDEVQVKTGYFWRQPLLGAGHLAPALEWRVLLLDLG